MSISSDQTLHALPNNTINLIGSCQVITSVYSVVKELVENSLDAGASSIDIKLDNYGLEKIEVCDNGCGVKAVDVPYMAKRHFTSKITCSEDLGYLDTYGFRGEALGSLCAVSNVTIATKTTEDQVCQVYTIGPEGDVVDKKPSHAGNGTVVTARNLFHNVPVRKQYYNAGQRKKDDLRRMEFLLMAYALVKPALRLTLKHGKDVIYQKTALKDVKSCMHSVLGRQIVNQMVYKEKCMEELKLKVSAFLPKPGSDVKDLSSVSAEKSFVCVNNRPVSLPEINKILRSYYSNCHGLDAYRHPVCFVTIDVASDLIDVNVDPNKTKVFFQQKLEVQNTLEEILVEIYGPLDNVPSWHYVEANASQKASKQPDESQTKSSSRPSIAYSKYPEMMDSETHNDTSSDNVTDTDVENQSHEDGNLPSFSLTFHPKSSHLKSKTECNENTILQTETNKCSSNSSSTSVEKSSTHNNENEKPMDNDNSFPSSKDNSELMETNFSEMNNNAVAMKDDFEVLSGSKFASEKAKEIDLVSDMGVCIVEDPNADNSSRACYDNRKNVPDEANDELSTSDKTGTVLNIGPDAWSKGTVTAADSPLQPVKLLVPSVVQKRGLSPGERNDTTLSQPRRKVAKLSLPSNQRTLLDMVNPGQMKKPESPFTHFYQEKFPIFSQKYPEEDETAIKERLKDAWDKQVDDERISYREKCWHDTKRYEKDVKAVNQKATKGNDKGKRVLKKRLYCNEKSVKVSLCDIKFASKEQPVSKDPNDKPKIIGPAYKSDDVWFCVLHNKLYIVNIWRLSEVALYKKLKAEHKLHFKPCDPLSLDSRAIHERGMIELERLARKDQGCGTFFHINDDRLVANGFDIKCHCDSTGNLTSELVGICAIIPTYDLKDLNKVLELIHSSTDVCLGETRTPNATHYLQGEAVRMARQNIGTKTLSDVQALLNDALENVNLQCLHSKPIFQELVDFTDLTFDDD